MDSSMSMVHAEINRAICTILMTGHSRDTKYSLEVAFERKGLWDRYVHLPSGSRGKARRVNYKLIEDEL